MVPLATVDSNGGKSRGSSSLSTFRFVEQTEIIRPKLQVEFYDHRQSNDAETGSNLPAAVTSVIFPPTDATRPSLFLCGRESGSVTLYDIAQSESQKGPLQYSRFQQIQYEDAVNDVSISADGLRMSVSLNDGTLRIVDVPTFRELHAFRDFSDGPVSCSSFSPQGNMVACGSYGGSLHELDVRTPRKYIRKLTPGHTNMVTSISFHPDGTVILTTGLDGLARVWDVLGQNLGTLPGSDRALGSGGFSPNGRYALLGSLDNDSLGLWDLAHSGGLKKVRGYSRLNSKYCMKACFTESGEIVGGSEDGRLYAWNPSSCAIIAEVDVSEQRGIRIPLTVAASKSYVACGGIGSSEPYLLKLEELQDENDNAIET